MQLENLKHQLSNNTLQPLYVFMGEEVGIMDIYIKKIEELSRKAVRRVDSIATIYSKLQNQAFMPTANCYIIRDDKDYLSQEKVWPTLLSGRGQGFNTIILVYTDIDKRSKFYKAHADIIVQFDKLIPEVLAKYIRRDIGLEVDLGVKFARACDNDYSRILLESDKLVTLKNVMNISIEEAYKVAMKEELIYTASRDVTFEFIDAVCRRQVLHSFGLLQELKSTTDSPLGAITLLYNNFKNILLVQSAGGGDIAGKTGLTGWQIAQANEKKGRYTVAELVRALKIIRSVETGIKTGKIESQLALDYVLVSII